MTTPDEARALADELDSEYPVSSLMQDAAIAALRDLAGAQERAEAAEAVAYEERNRLVALLAAIYPSGIARTDIPGWNAEWHGCVYIDFPWGQASWHYHDSHAHLFAHLPAYAGEWDGHTTEDKYQAIARAALAEGGGDG